MNAWLKKFRGSLVSEDFAQLMTLMTMWPNDRHHKWNYANVAFWIIMSKNNEKTVVQSYLNVLYSSTLFSSWWQYIQYSLDSLYGNYESENNSHLSLGAWRQELPESKSPEGGSKRWRGWQNDTNPVNSLRDPVRTHHYRKIFKISTCHSWLLSCLFRGQKDNTQKRVSLSPSLSTSFHKAKIHTVPWHTGGGVTV